MYLLNVEIRQLQFRSNFKHSNLIWACVLFSGKCNVIKRQISPKSSSFWVFFFKYVQFYLKQNKNNYTSLSSYNALEELVLSTSATSSLSFSATQSPWRLFESCKFVPALGIGRRPFLHLECSFNTWDPFLAVSFNFLRSPF